MMRRMRRWMPSGRWGLGVVLLLTSALAAAPPTEWVPASVAWFKCTGGAGNSNVSTTGAGTDFPHNLACTLDANRLVTDAVVRICATFTVASGSSVPQLTMRLKSGPAGTTPLVAAGGAFQPVPSVSRNAAVCFQIQGTAAAGASVPVYASVVSYPTSIAYAPDSNSLGPLVPLPTNGPLVFTFVSHWASNTGVASTLTLNALTGEVTHP